MGPLKPEQWAEVQRLFELAADLPAAERERFLDQECSSPDLRQEVVSLLQYTDVVPPAAQALNWIAEALSEVGDPDERQIGARLGPYRVEAIVGRGGMGAVYRASRDDAEFNQRVAIKLVRAAAESRSSLLRFRRERQILARLSHPNIARLLDGGSTAEGIPYLVMEFIEGQPVTEWCDQRGLGIEARLRLFLVVCQAVEFAHRELVVHRDLKPANILVTNDGEPKLLDFGIAKIIEPGSGGDSATRTGLPVMTPEYAAPEQVLGEPVSAASDVYGLGLVLYELLTGRKAQEIPSMTPAAIARVVCHMEPAAPAAIKRELAGDLDNMIRMAIRKEPHRRYANAAGLAADIQRYLDARPIAARADTFFYRTAKFVRRNRFPVIAGALMLLLAAGLILSLALERRAGPVAAQVTQLTQTSRANNLSGVAADASHVYFTQRSGQDWTLARVSVHGGTPELMTLSPSLLLPDIQDISPDHSQLLLMGGPPEGDNRAVWVMSLPGGALRKTGVMARSCAWSRTGDYIVYSRDEAVYRVEKDGSNPRKLFEFSGEVADIRCARAPLPDVMRFCIANAKTGSHAIWESASDGTGLHELIPGWEGSIGQDSSTWLASGKYFLFRTWRQRTASIWAMRGRRGFLPSENAPWRIYTSPLEFDSLAPAPDGSRIYFAGGQEHRELLHCDFANHQCKPFAEGIAARYGIPADGGHWMVYSSFPDSILWRCRPDGTLRAPLVPPSLVAGMPRTSPDGKSIAFVGFRVDIPGKPPLRPIDPGVVFVVPVLGGPPQEVTAGDWEPTWSPDGKSLLFGFNGRKNSSQARGLYVVNLETRSTTRLPHSETTLRAAWSPDGRFAAATNVNGSQISLYSFRTQSWAPLVSGNGLGFPIWSHDSNYVYYQEVFGPADEPIYRINVTSRKIDVVMSLKQIPQTNADHYSFGGLASDDSPIVSVKRTDSDIYALELDLP